MPSIKHSHDRCLGQRCDRFVPGSETRLRREKFERSRYQNFVYRCTHTGTRELASTRLYVRWKSIERCGALSCGSSSNLEEDRHTAVRLRQAFEELGPSFIEFGQLLSTRHDLSQRPSRGS